MPVFAIQVGIGQEQEQVAEVQHAAAHQVGEHRLNFGHRRGAGRNQILVPLLMARAGNQRGAIGSADLHQRVEHLSQRALATQQPEHHGRCLAHSVHQFSPGRLSGFVFAFQRHWIAGIHAHGVTPRHTDQGAFGGQDVGVRSGDKHQSGGRGWF